MPFSVQEIADFTQGSVFNGTVLGNKLDGIHVHRLSPLGISQASDLSFYFLRDFEHELPTAKPGILITTDSFARVLEKTFAFLGQESAIICCADPYSAFARLSEKFAALTSTVAHLPVGKESGKNKEIDPSALLDPTVECGEGVKIGSGCVIEKGVKIGAYSILYPGCYIGPDCILGESCVLFPRVTLYEWSRLGKGVRLHAGVVIGADGFGYAPRREGRKVIGHQKIYHLGNVVIEDDVEVGANTCIDRGTIGETRIGKNSKIDNLVQIGHNVRLDEGAVICGGTCLAGNARVGKYAYVGGVTGISNHVYVGDGALVGAGSIITKDVPPGGTAVGDPQRTHKNHFQIHALLNQMLAKRRKANE